MRSVLQHSRLLRRSPPLTALRTRRPWSVTGSSRRCSSTPRPRGRAATRARRASDVDPSDVVSSEAMLTPLPGIHTPADVRPVSGRFPPWFAGPFPWIAIGLALAVPGLLLAFIDADPTRGVTGSQSPFTDEAWNLLNSRNFALLGTWSTDQFNLSLVYGPFSLLE